MAVPKKRLSKAKGRTRIARWKEKGKKTAKRAMSLAKSAFNKDSSFIFNLKKLKLEEKKKKRVEEQKLQEEKQDIKSLDKEVDTNNDLNNNDAK
uniref:50S ribosomal protein L32 n=1 Tax=Analipus japonicus TaxID=31333 RepID=UPI002E774214|nr:50S ribosomal protein L32 [Analipus japonicus]WAM61910.1 50S ribosomal protein L32 [Analipus japonicus]